MGWPGWTAFDDAGIWIWLVTASPSMVVVSVYTPAFDGVNVSGK